jgi:membrane protease YdiL (CAAX protease family)
LAGGLGDSSRAVLAVLFVLKTQVARVFAPNHFWIGVTFGCAAGFFEKIGRTGFAFPMMRLRWSAVRAGVILGLVWSLWHIPVIDYLGSATPHAPDLIPFFLAFLAAMTAVRVLICWAYCNTQSLLLAQMMHASSTAAWAVLGPSRATARREAWWWQSTRSSFGSWLQSLPSASGRLLSASIPEQIFLDTPPRWQQFMSFTA